MTLERASVIVSMAVLLPTPVGAKMISKTRESLETMQPDKN